MSDLEAIQSMLQPGLPGLLGLKLTELSPTCVRASLEVRAELCTVGNRCHGGVYMAFADTLGAVGAFVNLPAGATTATIESSTKFLGGASTGTNIVGVCEPLHRGGSTSVWQTQVSTEDGKLLAVITQTQLVLGA